MNTLYFTNPFHLGDCMFCIIFFNNIIYYIEKNNIIINFSCHLQYRKQLNEFIMSPNIVLSDFDNIDRLNLWIGNNKLPFNIFNQTPNMSLNQFLLEFYNNIILNNQVLFGNLPILETKIFQYTDPDLITRYNKLNEKYKDIDILIVNSDCMSGQCSNDRTYWNDIINMYNKKYKIVTTNKIENINCTLDDDLTLKDIGAISTHTKIIIAVNTGVITSFYNSYTLNNVLQVYYIDNTRYYDYIKWSKINDITDMTDIMIDKYLITRELFDMYSKNYPLINKMCL